MLFTLQLRVCQLLLVTSLILALGSICRVSVNAQTQSAVAPRGDNQIWSEFQLAIPVRHQVDFVLLGITRFGRNISRPVSERIGAGISVKAGKHFTFFPFYLYVASQPTSSNHSTEHRITLEVTGKFPVKELVISDRNRVEFHLHSPRPNFVQYRNRMQLEHPLKFHDLDGFVADEIFYDSLAAAWIRNRMYLGVAKKVNKHFVLDIYFLRQNDSHSHPGDLNALGSTLKFRL